MPDFLIRAEYRDLTDQTMPLCDFIVTAATEEAAIKKAEALTPALKSQGWVRVESVEFHPINLTEWIEYRRFLYRSLKGTSRRTKKAT